ncbi:probable Protein CSN12 homolog [Ustilago trichophora]|uniref:Probable Protein CSN12 homolog n=1 Tax=Ustilago trichophora TaxID=86804 RepID=A0A5C3ETH0_9BASI|nr:probable Protein CSN12 homolog [Ustilago trichophora]
MKPSIFADAVITASQTHDGHSLAQLFAIGGPVAASVLLELGDARPHRIISSLRRCSGYLASPWEDMCMHHLTALYSFSLASSMTGYSSDAVDGEGKTRAERLGEAFDAYNAAVTAFLRHFATLTPGRWAVPLLRILCLNLRWLAVQADTAALEVIQKPLPPTVNNNNNNNTSQAVANAISNMPTSTSSSSTVRTSSIANKKLEECARQLNKAFTACIADRNSELEESRKWGTYEIVGLVFKTYFRLKSVSLCRNILRAINAAVLPELGSFPRSQQVTFRYYVGVLAFLNEEYDRAEAELGSALQLCHKDATTNQTLILTYLIPVKLLKGFLPHPALLTAIGGGKLIAYTPFITALRQGDVKSFDTLLTQSNIESWLVKKGTFIAMERVREATLRTLLKRIWLSLPSQSPKTRLSISTIHHATASHLVNLNYTLKDLEWFIATLIFKGFIKGYIAHQRGVLVLSAKDPFPRLATVPIITT